MTSMQRKVAALIAARHTVGSAYETRARMKLALDIGERAGIGYVSETSVRNWQRGTWEPSPVYAKAITELYDAEVGRGQ